MLALHPMYSNISHQWKRRTYPCWVILHLFAWGNTLCWPIDKPLFTSLPDKLVILCVTYGERMFWWILPAFQHQPSWHPSWHPKCLRWGILCAINAGSPLGFKDFMMYVGLRSLILFGGNLLLLKKVSLEVLTVEICSAQKMLKEEPTHRGGKKM